MTDAYTRLLTFTEHDLPDLDEVVLGSLEYLDTVEFPHLDTKKYTRPLVVGSGNALAAGQLLFRGTQAHFAEEGEAALLLRDSAFDALYIISASGAKHAIMLAKKGTEAKLPTYLITANESAPARAIVGKEMTIVFPHVREPYTYNTSTYLSMLFGGSKESPGSIRAHIEDVVKPCIPKLDAYAAYLFVVPSSFGPVRKMLETKFDELFGPHIVGRAFTAEEMKHAKTVVTSPQQCMFTLGIASTLPSEAEQVSIPLQEGYGPAELIAVGYYLIGHIQKANHPYFKERIGEYVKETSSVFGHHISVIVE